MTLPITQFIRRHRVKEVCLSKWRRPLLTGTFLVLYPALAVAQTLTVPASAAPSEDGQWTMPAKNYAATRYSALDGINGANVSDLQVAFAFSTGVDHGQEAAPIVANNTMFLVTAYPNIGFALDLTKPGAGFENKIVKLIAQDLGATVDYTWWEQRRGYVRHTLKADICDIWPGVASGVEMMTSSRPYDRSSYAFVTRADRGLHIASFDDPELHELIIGVQMVGADAMNAPPAHALARHGIVQNVRAYMLYGDYRKPHPPSAIIDAVEDRDVDVAVVWGPMAGYFAARGSTPLTIERVQPWRDGAELPMAFHISMGVRRGDNALLQRFDDSLEKSRCAVATILADYHVPVLPEAFATP